MSPPTFLRSDYRRLAGAAPLSAPFNLITGDYVPSEHGARAAAADAEAAARAVDKARIVGQRTTPHGYDLVTNTPLPELAPVFGASPSSVPVQIHSTHSLAALRSVATQAYRTLSAAPRGSGSRTSFSQQRHRLKTCFYAALHYMLLLLYALRLFAALYAPLQCFSSRMWRRLSKDNSEPLLDSSLRNPYIHV